MNFRTKIDIPAPGFAINHQNIIIMMGSCFAESIGRELENAKFNINVNPFGVLYNPQSISQALSILREGKLFSENDVFEHDGLFHSYYHHSRFSDENITKCLEKINTSIEMASSQLKSAGILFVTFGTAYVYRLKDRDMIVGNCHKLPADKFERYRLDTETIVNTWATTIKELRTVNPQLKLIFTVSPIRHLKDGAHENQLSKSALLLAIDELCRIYEDVSYFPSYEIVLDELRDYRFYDEDMTHPNNIAIKYIWERIRETYFSPLTDSIINEWIKLSAAMGHRPFNIQGERHKHFLKQTLLKTEDFQRKYPYIYCEKEIAAMRELLERFE